MPDLKSPCVNAFTGYKPQLSWNKHDTSNWSTNGAKGAARVSARLYLPGSGTTGVKMMDIPNRDSINTETTRPADKTAKIRRGGR
jgi:hypothetical protein